MTFRAFAIPTSSAFFVPHSISCVISAWRQKKKRKNENTHFYLTDRAEKKNKNKIRLPKRVKINPVMYGHKRRDGNNVMTNKLKLNDLLCSILYFGRDQLAHPIRRRTIKTARTSPRNASAKNIYKKQDKPSYHRTCVYSLITQTENK